MGKKSRMKRERGCGPDRAPGDVLLAFLTDGKPEFCQFMSRADAEAMVRQFGPNLVEIMEPGTYELTPGWKGAPDA